MSSQAVMEGLAVEIRNRPTKCRNGDVETIDPDVVSGPIGRRTLIVFNNGTGPFTTLEEVDV